MPAQVHSRRRLRERARADWASDILPLHTAPRCRSRLDLRPTARQREIHAPAPQTSYNADSRIDAPPSYGRFHRPSLIPLAVSWSRQHLRRVYAWFSLGPDVFPQLKWKVADVG